MTGPDEDGSTERLITRRGVAKGLGGVVGGAALGVGGVVAVAERSDYVDLDGLVGRWLPKKDPPATRPDENPATGTTPWDQDTVVVSIERDGSLAGFDYVPPKLAEATAFWNEYIDTDEPFDLTLSFEPDHADPDILFVEHSLMDCYGEYESPATEDPELTEQVCVATLTEHPDETPVTADIGTGLHGEAFYGLVARHALGRLLGYDVWSAPVDVMNPKLLVGPAHADHPDATSMLGTPSHRDDECRRLATSIAEQHLPSIRDADSESIGEAIRSARDDLGEFLDEHEREMSEWAREAEDFGYPRYVDAYEKTVGTDEIAHLHETVRTMSDLVEDSTGEEIAASDERETVETRLETVTDWPSTREAWDVQIHRHFSDAVWSEWVDE